jgi:hypothetical protein
MLSISTCKHREATELEKRAEPIIGKAGSVRIMHPLAVPGSDANNSDVSGKAA